MKPEKSVARGEARISNSSRGLRQVFYSVLFHLLKSSPEVLGDFEQKSESEFWVWVWVDELSQSSEDSSTQIMRGFNGGGM